MFLIRCVKFFYFGYDIETRLRFLTQGILLVIRSKIFDPRFNVCDSLCEVYEVRCYVFNSFCKIFKSKYDVFDSLCKVFDPMYDVCDLRHGLLHSSSRQYV
jgi:hypothetical protein